MPILLAGNPVNFAKPTKLTTAEALAAALYIGGFKLESEDLLSIFKWGHNFFDLNRERLDLYATAKSSGEIVEMQRRFMASIED